MTNPTSENLLLIFIKNPIPGKVKTRLANDIGEDKAVGIYKKMLNLTHAAAVKANSDRWICYGDFINENDIWTIESFGKKLQTGDNLGERMFGFFKAAFETGYKRVIIIGSDCPEINSEDIDGSFDLLKRNDAVIGPANDGGYYLLGLSQNKNIFENKSWSTETVFKDTIEDFQKLKMSFHVLEEKVDLDTFEDLEKFPWL